MIETVSVFAEKSFTKVHIRDLLRNFFVEFLYDLLAIPFKMSP